MKTMTVKEREADMPLFKLSPPSEIRRGGALLLLICALLLAIGRVAFWHGKATSELAAFVLYLLAMYLSFGLAQFVVGVSINEVYRNFHRTTGRQKLFYFLTIALSLSLLWPLCSFLLPGIEHKLPR